MPKLFFLTVFSAFSCIAQAAQSDDTWMSVLLDGRKIGSMHTTRTVTPGHVITTQALEAEMDRAGIKIGLATHETNDETPAGEPLAFESRTKISGIESITRGRVRDDRKIEVSTEVGGAQQHRVIDWPKGALLSEGLRLAEQNAGSKPGTHFENLAFQSDSLNAVAIETRIGETARVDLPGGARTLTRIEQTIKLPGAPTQTTAWADKEQNVQKLVIPVLGYELTMLACSQACANGPNQSADILVDALLQSPQPITAVQLAHGIELTLAPTDGNSTPLLLASTDEQRVSSPTDGKTRVRIAPLDEDNIAVNEAKPAPEDVEANDWLQSDAPEVIALARRGAADAKTPRDQMQNLENFVRAFIRTKDLSVGYASALEVAKNPQGDCTEHAVLLAALGRSMGIATRVVDGLAYVDFYAGHAHVFVPHAWVQAYVDGHWRSYDAALHGFDSGHLALAVGDGDPWKFFAGFNTLGRMRVREVQAIE